MFTISEVMGSNLVVHAGDAIPDGESHVMTEIPQSAIEARDKMYTKNEYMPNSFWHEMMIPDDVFPPLHGSIFKVNYIH